MVGNCTRKPRLSVFSLVSVNAISVAIRHPYPLCTRDWIPRGRCFSTPGERGSDGETQNYFEFSISPDIIMCRARPWMVCLLCSMIPTLAVPSRQQTQIGDDRNPSTKCSATRCRNGAASSTACLRSFFVTGSGYRPRRYARRTCRNRQHHRTLRPSCREIELAAPKNRGWGSRDIDQHAARPAVAMPKYTQQFAWS